MPIDVDGRITEQSQALLEPYTVTDVMADYLEVEPVSMESTVLVEVWL